MLREYRTFQMLDFSVVLQDLHGIPQEVLLVDVEKLLLFCITIPIHTEINYRFHVHVI